MTAIEAEVEKHGSGSDKECLAYVLHGNAGSNETEWPHAGNRRMDIFDDPTKADGRAGQPLAFFVNHAKAKQAGSAFNPGKRKIVELGATAKESYGAGPQRMEFSVPKVSVEHLSRHVLTNVGLLLATLYSGEEEVLQVSMVTQVTPADDGTLIRSVFNPLE